MRSAVTASSARKAKPQAVNKKFFVDSKDSFPEAEQVYGKPIPQTLIF